MVVEEIAGDILAGEMAPLGDAVTGSAFMLRPVADDQFVMIISISLRNGVAGSL